MFLAFSFYDHEPRGSWANAVAHSSDGSAVSSAVSSGGSVVRPSEPCGSAEPMTKPCGSSVPIAPIARFPFGSGVRSVRFPVLPPESETRPCRSEPVPTPVARFPFGSAVSSASASGGARAHAFASYYPTELRRDCHESK